MGGHFPKLPQGVAPMFIRFELVCNAGLLPSSTPAEDPGPPFLRSWRTDGTRRYSGELVAGRKPAGLMEFRDT
jgi:hypothetical protein